MDISQYTGEHIYRFPVPTQTPLMWISLAGITHGDDYRQNSGYTVIEYVFSGTGTLRVGDSVYYPACGDMCIVPENADYHGTADPADPWTKMVIHLKGTAAEPFVQAFDLEEKILYQNCVRLQRDFEEIFTIIRSDDPVEQIMERCSMVLMKLFTCLCGNTLHTGSASDDVRLVKRYIENNYHKNLSMDEISASVYRSNDYVQKQFKQVYGKTPYAYYMDLKAACAKELLIHTNLTVWQIAEKLGYKSDRYFSAQFRRMTGMTATQYRRLKR